MPLTPDAAPGVRQEEGIDWDSQSSEPTDENRLQLVDDTGLCIFIDGVSRSIGETRKAVWQSEIDEINIDTPPVGPVAGYRVIVGASPTGDFVGHSGEVAQYNGSSWVFSTPRKGSSAYVKSEDDLFLQVASSTPWNWRIGGGYPPAFDTVVSDGSETTTLVDWQEKLSVTTPSLELGSYFFLAQAVMSGSKSNAQYEVRSQYDDTDSFGVLKAQTGIAFSEYTFFSHTIKEGISGVHTIDVDYRKVSGSGYVIIRGVRITYWRISSG